MNLPEHYLEKMKRLLGEEYSPWLASYGQPPVQGIRVNARKLKEKQWGRICPWDCRPVLWNDYGYYPETKAPLAKHPFYYAGLYYIQEPSAMAPAQLLDVRPGDRVLDLCAAPGGKSTDLGARLAGKGLLVSNDISVSRGKALVKNLEMAGIDNVLVTGEPPEKLADAFSGFFDKILVDAPCSGEGMFRKDPELIKSWLKRGPSDYAAVQKEVLLQAVRMLRPGGSLVYSTCTFSREEDEDVVAWLLGKAPEMELVPLAPWEGALNGAGGEPVIRLYPHKVEGEGHFMALFHKMAGDGQGAEKSMATGEKASGGNARPFNEAEASSFKEWERMLAHPLERGRMMVREGRLYYLPEAFDPGWNLRYLRTGLLLGSLKKGRFEPPQAAAMALGQEDFAQTLSLDQQDARVVRYLKGETILLQENEKADKGWVLVCVAGFPLGWGKYANGMLKNKYYPGWRWQ